MFTNSIWYGGITLLLVCFAPPAAAQCRLFEITPADGGQDEFFGYAVAMHGDRAVVGAPTHTHQGTMVGGAWVFDPWTGAELLELVPTGGLSGILFGLDVSLDGTQALVGSRYAQEVHVFDLVTGQQLQELVASTGFAGDYFGVSVSIDAGLAIVGAPNDDDRGPKSGSAYVFDTGTGNELFKLNAGKEGGWFGRAVDIDGTRAIVGAPQNGKSGVAYVYDLNTGNKLHRLIPSDGKKFDTFGWSVALDGNRALVGAFENDAVFENSGAAYVFDLTTGQELMKLIPSDPIAMRGFGWRVEMDGTRAIISHAPGSYPGAAYVFDLETGEELMKLETLDKPATDGFGDSVAIDGERAIVGAPQAHALGHRSGSAFLFSILESIGTSYCGPAVQNSTGNPAVLAAVGCSQVTENFVRLEATQLPANRFGYFLTSETQGFQASPPGSQGNLCLAGNIGRFADQVGDSGPAGQLTLQVDLTALPTSPPQSVLAGETWSFQCWYRDGNPTPTSNFTEGVAITFL